MRNVYLDYSATTPVKEEVLKEMIPYFTEKFGNPSSLYDKGLEAKAAVDHAREQLAALINADPKEIYFTAGGTEADNWSLMGVADKLKDKGNHIITTKIEHHAILHSCEFLEKHGYEVTYLGIDENGRISLEELENAITDKTILISVMMVNNEIGTVQPIKEIGKIAKALAFTVVTPDDRPQIITYAISICICCIMCPLMSLVATLLFKETKTFGTWNQTWAMNFKVAICYQMFYCGPLVRLIFRTIFERKGSKATEQSDAQKA